MARIYFERLNHPEIAYNYCKEAVNLVEKTSINLINEEFKSFFSIKSVEIYSYMILICLKLDKNIEAYEYLEKCKSRAFLEIMANSDISPKNSTNSRFQELLAKENSLLSIIRRAQTNYIKNKTDNEKSEEIDKILKELEDIYKEMESYDAEYVAQRKGKTLSFEEICMHFQTQNNVIVEYFYTGDQIIIFFIRPVEKKITVKNISINEEKIIHYTKNYFEYINSYVQDLEKGEEKEIVDKKTHNTEWLDFGRYLIEPIADLLKSDDIIFFIPFGVIHYFPLQALSLKDKQIIDSNPIVYLSSASIMKYLNKKQSINSIVSFSNGFDNETHKISTIFTDEQHFTDATKQTVLENISNKDIIHFACHGAFNWQDPLQSGLKLYDGMLTAKEIFNLKINSSLVVLSACQTGLNFWKPGDEIIGLTRAFQYAGTSSLLVSAWSVYSDSTEKFMLLFYKNLRKGFNKVAAVQNAYKELKNTKGYEAPFYWAPFMLIGK